MTDKLAAALREVLRTREIEAKTAMSYENAAANFSRSGRERYAAERAMFDASAAEKAARAALAEHDAQPKQEPVASGVPWWQIAKDCGCWTDTTDGDMGYVHFGSTEALRVFVVKITAQAYAAGKLHSSTVVNKFGDALKPEWAAFMRSAVDHLAASQPAQPVAPTDGWTLVKVAPGFEAIVEALERAEKKGHMPDDIFEPFSQWAGWLSAAGSKTP
jgi:hypothetical protein